MQIVFQQMYHNSSLSFELFIDEHSREGESKPLEGRQTKFKFKFKMEQIYSITHII